MLQAVHVCVPIDKRPHHFHQKHVYTQVSRSLLSHLSSLLSPLSSNVLTTTDGTRSFHGWHLISKCTCPSYLRVLILPMIDKSKNEFVQEFAWVRDKKPMSTCLCANWDILIIIEGTCSSHGWHLIFKGTCPSHDWQVKERVRARVRLSAW